MDKRFELLDYWLLDEQQTQLKIIHQILRIINSSQCKTIFAILNKHEKITCPQIVELGGVNLDSARFYQYLKKLEKLNFVNTVRIDNLMHYSMERSEIVDFIDCINSNFAYVTIHNTAGESDFLELNFIEKRAQKRYFLDYSLASHLQDCVNCMLSKGQRDLLKLIFEKLYKDGAQVKSKHKHSTCVDAELASSTYKQPSVNRNLKVLAKFNLIIRTREKNFRHNTLNVEHILKICRFLIDNSHRNFNKENNPRKRVHAKAVKLRPNLGGKLQV